MYRGLLVAVVVPCYNEEAKVADVISTLPDLIDRIYLVDDASQDLTVKIASNVAKNLQKDIVIIQHQRNSGVGAAISSGYKKAYADNYDLVLVMAGDGQMDPADMEGLLKPLALGYADYAKGNRLKAALGDKIPLTRLFGNLALTVLTKIVSGYWHVSDTQCGYTAINREALAAVCWDDIYPSYGCPNDILTRLNVADMRVIEAKVKPIYGENWTSKMKITKVIFPIFFLMGRLFLYRMYRKYIYISGHPIVLFYMAGFVSMLISFALVTYIIIQWIATGVIPTVATIVFGTALGVAIQLILNAFVLDYQVNNKLCIEDQHTRPRHHED